MGKRKSIYIEGFRDRLFEVCDYTGLSKTQLAKLCGFDRKTFYDDYQKFNSQMNSGYLARFCAVTGASADWLLGLKSRPEKIAKKLVR